VNDFDRHHQIIEIVKERPFASVRDLQEMLGVSAATIRRDIDKLHDGGQVRKVYGGISAPEGVASGRLSARYYDENRDLAVEAKRAIAATAETLIRDGDSVIIHGGSTCFQLGVRLAKRNIRIFTNSMPLAAYLGERGTCQLVVAGGDLHREPGIIQSAGAPAPAFFATKFFVGTQGVSVSGLQESHPLLVKAIQDLSTCADQIVVLADSRKFATRARNIALPLSRIGTIITDDGLKDADAKMLVDEGISILIAQINGGDA
jgi:DeoR family ulaG and ulaABCDEF operon transcriptional repressor